ncbi:hypothetical protein ACIQV2_24230 [Streptomyces globosus]|uniref:nSTAND1 domain-containing NTPase n=1 Tax=Streptomyces globosus TaxID=68209 RepID=UPI00381780D0
MPQPPDGPPVPASGPGPASDAPGQHIDVAGSGTAYVAGRDQHLHFPRPGGANVHRAGAADTDCPYPGLAAFGPQDAQWYFGRDRLVAELLERLAQRIHTPGLQLVVAASGAGKSSLLRAGLTRAVSEGRLPARRSRDWPQLIMTPTAEPVSALDEHLRTLPGPGDPGRRFLLIVDQFEELFTLCDDEKQREAFVARLAGLANARALVVLGLRADFYGHCSRYPQLREAARDGQVVVGPMSRDEIEQAIVLPAAAVGLELEPGLVDLLLHDLGMALPGTAEEAGRLPLLAHALRATWQRRHGHLMTADGYRETGGIHEALARTAERTYEGLDPAGRAAAQDLFLRLVMIGEDSDPARRRIVREDLADGGAEAVVEAFTRARLLTQGRTAGERAHDTVEISHEALLRGWPRLRQWIENERAGGLVRRSLVEAAERWRSHGRDPSFLHRGSRLATARAWAEHPGNRQSVPPGVREFLAAATARERRGVRRLYQAVAALTALLLATGAALLYAGEQRGRAEDERNTALARLLATRAPDLYAADPGTAAQLAAAAWTLAPNPQTAGAVLDLADRPAARVLRVGHKSQQDSMRDARFNFDGTLLVTNTAEGPVQLRDVATLRLLDELPGAVTVRFHPRRNVLAAAPTSGGPVRLYRVSAEGRATLTAELPEGPDPYSVVFNPSGDMLAVGQADGTVQLWNVTDPARPRANGTPLRTGEGEVSSVGSVFSPDGRTLAVTRFGRPDSVVTLWRVGGPDTPPTPAGTLGGPAVLEGVRTFSPDGRLLAGFGVAADGIQLWDVSDLDHPVAAAPPLDKTGHVTSVLFAKEGRVLITAAQGGLGDARGGVVQFRDVSDPARPRLLAPELAGQPEAIHQLTLSPDGKTLAAAAADHTVRLWDLTALNRPAPLHASRTGQVTGAWAEFGPGGRFLTDESAVWDTADPAQPRLVDSLYGVPIGTDRPALAPDGATFTVGRATGTEAWDVRNPVSPRKLAVPDAVRHAAATPGPDGLLLYEAESGVHVARPAKAPDALGFLKGRMRQALPSPRGPLVATVDFDDHVTLWDVTDAAAPEPHGPGFQVAGAKQMVFSPDGRTLAIGTFTHRVELWDVSGPGRPRLLGGPLTGPTNEIAAMAVSPDSRTLAVSAADGSLRLWDLTDRASPALLGRPRDTDGSVTALAFRDAGDTLLAVVKGSGSDAVLQSWSASPSAAVRRICEATGPGPDRTQWERHLRGVAYEPPCTKPPAASTGRGSESRG